jgi:acetyl esterase/lipase
MVTRRSVSISLAAALGTLTLRAEGQQDPTQRPMVYSVPGMANAKVREGIVYKTAEGSPLHFDVYSPATAARATPAVILVHGTIPAVGARRWGVFTSYGRALAALGMTGIAFDHRLLGVERLRDSATDLADLVRHVRQNAKTLGIDESRMALWSFSRGASLMTSALRERQKWWKLLVAYYGLMEPPGAGADFSAIAALGKDASNAPPIVLARAGKDDPALNATLDRFVAAANSAGATVDLLTHPTGQHGFDVLDPGERSSQIIRRTLEALRSALGAGSERKG